METLCKRMLMCAALVSALSACERSSDKKDEPPAKPAGSDQPKPAPPKPNGADQNKPPSGETAQPAPAPAQPAPAPAQTPAPPPAPKPNQTAQGPGPTAPPPQAVVQPPNLPGGSPTVVELKPGPSEPKNRLESARDALRDMFHVDETQQNASEAYESNSQDVRGIRDLDLDDVRSAIAATKPVPQEAALKAVNSKAEIPALVASIVSAPNPQQVSEDTDRLVDEIYNEYGKVRGKAWQLKAALLHLYYNKLYTRDARIRMAYAQAQILQRARDLRDYELTRDGLMIAGTSLAFGTIAGYHGFQRTRETLHDTHPAQQAKAWVNTLENEVVAHGGTKRLTSSLGRMLLSSEKVTERNLKAIGLEPQRVSNLQLTKLKRGKHSFHDFEPTNMPEMRYSVVDKIGDVELRDERIVLISLSRPERGSNTPDYLITRRMSQAEADALVDEIKFRTPTAGGKNFVALADESGVVGQRLEQEEVDEARALAARAEQENGAAPAVTEGASETAARAQSTVQQVVRPKREFDKRWAATVAAGTGVLSTAFFYEGYRRGDAYGVNSGAFFLESLIPPGAFDRSTVSLTSQAE